MVVYVPQAVVSIAPPPAPQPPPAEQPSPTGRLVLEVQPGTAQVFVDGYYVGTPDDSNLASGALVLEPGPHRIELSAPGYEPVSFDVRIMVNQSITYRQVLKPIQTAPPPPPHKASAPKTIYMIPGCYVGDVPPKEAGLPATCDVSRAITLRP